jgi:hypothetical protein
MGIVQLMLETFVEQARFKGGCCRAANWLHVGQTKGQGKLGTAVRMSDPIKDVWPHPLEKFQIRTDLSIKRLAENLLF